MDREFPDLGIANGGGKDQIDVGASTLLVLKDHRKEFLCGERSLEVKSVQFQQLHNLVPVFRSRIAKVLGGPGNDSDAGGYPVTMGYGIIATFFNGMAYCVAQVEKLAYTRVPFIHGYDFAFDLHAGGYDGLQSASLLLKGSVFPKFSKKMLVQDNTVLDGFGNPVQKGF